MRRRLLLIEIFTSGGLIIYSSSRHYLIAIDHKWPKANGKFYEILISTSRRIKVMIDYDMAT